MGRCASVEASGRRMILWQQGTTLEKLLSLSGTAGSTLQSVPPTPTGNWSLPALPENTVT